MTISILIINGPNLNLLGTRQPEIYGSETLIDVEENCVKLGNELGAKVACMQSNHEGVIVDEIQAARGKQDAIIINAGAYTHTSIAIRDAFSGTQIPLYEVHISDIHAREAFRHNSYLSDIAKKVIIGHGTKGYEMALRAAVEDLSS